MRFILPSIIIVISAAATANSQTYNSMSGGYNTGYGTVYGSFGMAAATQSMYNSMQINMQRAVMRQTLLKKHGQAWVDKMDRAAAAGGSSGVAATLPPRPPAPKNYGKFRPDSTVDTGKVIADALGETPEEKALYKQIVDGTRAAFEKDPSSAVLKNNLAGAFTFFLVATGTVYHNSPEPTDETVKALFEAVSQTIDEIPEFGKMSNRDKQAMYNTLIGFAGIPLATYAEGKETKHQPTIDAARQLAGNLVEIVLKTGPDRLKFENGELRFQ